MFKFARKRIAKKTNKAMNKKTAKRIKKSAAKKQKQKKNIQMGTSLYNNDKNASKFSIEKPTVFINCLRASFNYNSINHVWLGKA